MTAATSLGLGIGWRPQTAALVLRRGGLGFVEVLAEAFPSERPLPLPLVEARRRGVAVVPHGVGLSLGGADPPDPRRLASLADLALRVEAPLVSEHVAFVRAGRREAGHLLPVARSRAALEVLVENVRTAVEALPVPLALEPVASLLEWPDAEIDEGEFLTELLERTGALLLLDVANVYANARNHGFDPLRLIEQLPLDRVAYVHVAGGTERDGLYHDTHAHAVPSPVLEILDAVTARSPVPGVMLERDDRFPPTPAVEAELDAIAAATHLIHGTGSSNAPKSVPIELPEPEAWGSGSSQVDRSSVASDQDALLGALVGGGPVPEGFDTDQVMATRAALLAKKSRDRRPDIDGMRSPTPTS